MQDETPKPPGRPLSIWEVLDRLDDRCRARKGVRLTNETAWILLAALRAYVAHPKTATIAGLVCTSRTVKSLPCEPLCQRCLSTAAEIRRVYKGEINPFGRGDWDQGRR